MGPSATDQHQKGADNACCEDGEDFVFDELKMQHQSHSGRNKEKRHVPDQKRRYRLHPFQTDPFKVEGSAQEQHANDARWKGDFGVQNDAFPDGQTAEDDE